MEHFKSAFLLFIISQLYNLKFIIFLLINRINLNSITVFTHINRSLLVSTPSVEISRSVMELGADWEKSGHLRTVEAPGGL